jgi:diguanylate cyclase (GGDEF)-like protein/PAS domain S-box-containing protein
MSRAHGAFDRSVLDALAEGVAVIDATGAIVFCNRAGAEILGLTLDEVSGRFYSDGRFEPVDDSGAPVAAQDLPIARVLATGEQVVDWPIGISTPDGERRWLTVNAHVSESNASGRPELVIASFRDVTTFRKNALELERRLTIEHTLTSVSQSFIDRAADDLAGCLADGLRDLVAALAVDRGLVFKFADGRISEFHEYCRPGVSSTTLDAGDQPTIEEQPIFRAALEHQHPIIIPDTHAIELSAAGRDLLERSGARAIVAVPMVHQGVVVGLIAVDDIRAPRAWSDADLNALDRFAAIVITGRARHEAAREQRSLEARFAALVEHSWDVIIVISGAGELTFANSRIERMVGLTPDDLLGSNVLELIHPDDLDAALASISRVLTGDNEGRIIDLRLRHRDGHWVPVEVVGNNLLDDPAINGIVVNVRDTTERRLIEGTLHEAQSLFEEVFEHGTIGLVLVTQSRRIFRVNPAMCRMLGYTAEELCERTITDITHPDDRAEAIERHDELMSGNQRAYTYEKRYLRKDGQVVWCRVNVNSVSDSDGSPSYQIGHIEDITAQRAIAEQLEREARHDSLTDLPSRKVLLERLDRALHESRRGAHGQVAVLFIDLDHFKQVNDTLGHAAGDELLISVARAIQMSLRGSDIAGRFGGDEFVVLCTNLASPADATIVADRIRRRLSAPFIVQETEVFVGASIGIAIADHRSDAAGLMTEADTAAYRAKDRGRNRVEVFDRELRTAVARRVEIATALRHVIENGELVLHYQPLVAVDSSSLDGFEALVRWERPGTGLISPADFLPIAEERGLIVSMGRWITETACRQLATWNEGDTPTSMGVNLSPRQLGSGQLVREVRNILDDTGIDPTRLCFEITENALVDDAETAIRRLEELRDLGVRLAIDDFGTGYSSLSYLRRLPVQVVKIDRSFVLALGTDHEGSTIVASVINLAHALGMEIVAEGVETIEHVAALVNLGCDKMQGYWFSRPVPVEQATELLAGGGTWSGERWNTAA